MSRIHSRFSVLLFLIVALFLVLAPGTAEADTAIYRFYKATTGEHFYTRIFTEGIYAQGVFAEFKSEGIGFRIYSSGGADLAPIYRCFAGRHFISLDVNCEVAGPSAREDTYGWVHQTQVMGTVPLKRYYRAGTSDHFYTIDMAEGDAALASGYVFAQTMGYVVPYPVTTVTGLACDGTTDDTVALQSALNNGQGGRVIIPAGPGACMVSGLAIPDNTQVTVNATLKFLPNRTTPFNAFDGSRHILNVYGTPENHASNVVIDGTGMLDGNRSQQAPWAAAGPFMAGIGTLFADTVIIRGLTVRNMRNSPVSVVWANGAVIQDVTAYDSADPPGFAGITSYCSADGLRIYNMDHPGEAGFSFYGGANHCALRNSVISNNTHGVQVLNDRCQPFQSHDIVVENVEVYSNSEIGLQVATHPDYPQECLYTPPGVNYNVTFQNVRVHANFLAYNFESGTNINLIDLDDTGGGSSRSVITGNIDGWSIPAADGSRDFQGWACAMYDPDPIRIAAFHGGNSFIGLYRADSASEPGVGGPACHSGGVAHRFVIHFSPAMLSQWAGETMWIYGWSPWGFGYTLIPGSGSSSFTVPAS